MKCKSIIFCMLAVCQTVLSEIRLTFVNETPYGVFVYYTTAWEQVSLHKPEEITLTGADIEGLVRSRMNYYKGDPVYIAPHTRYTLYHAGLISAKYMYLQAVDARSKKPNGVPLYCEGVSHEKYDAGWLYEQVWQDGDRWNWTLWIKTEQ